MREQLVEEISEYLEKQVASSERNEIGWLCRRAWIAAGRSQPAQRAPGPLEGEASAPDRVAGAMACCKLRLRQTLQSRECRRNISNGNPALPQRQRRQGVLRLPRRSCQDLGRNDLQMGRYHNVESRLRRLFHPCRG